MKKTALPALDPTLKSKIRMLHAQGYTAQEIARRIRVNSAMTRIYMNRLKLDATPSARSVAVKRPCVSDCDLRYDAPGQIVFERAREFVTVARSVSVFSVSSLI